MDALAVEIAFAKASRPAECEMLGEAVSLALRLDLLEAAFEGKINASKAARGELPTKLPRSKQSELMQLHEDERELEVQQIVELQAAELER